MTLLWSRDIWRAYMDDCCARLLKAQFFQGDKKIFSLNKSSDLILLFCCSSISEKLHSINKVPYIGGLACLCTTAIKCNSVLLYCFCIVITTLTVIFSWKEWSMNGQVCMCVCNRQKRNTWRDIWTRDSRMPWRDHKELCSQVIKLGNV